jgi:hypothetical protein
MTSAAEVMPWGWNSDWSMYYCVAIICHAATLRLLGCTCKRTFPSTFGSTAMRSTNNAFLDAFLFFSSSLSYTQKSYPNIGSKFRCPFVHQTMAELSLACSVIQVLRVSEALLTQAYEYGDSVKNADSAFKSPA